MAPTDQQPEHPSEPPGAPVAWAKPEIRAAELRTAALMAALDAHTGQDVFFLERAHGVLPSLLLAAHLVGLPEARVRAWVGDPDDTTPSRLLRAHRGRVPDGWTEDLDSGWHRAPEPTRSAVAAVLDRALARPTTGRPASGARR